MAQTPVTTFINEGSLTKRPRDVDVTPNGSRVLVRSNGLSDGPLAFPSQELTLWDARTGTMLAINCSHGQLGRGVVTEGYASDAQALTNDIAVSIGQRKIVTGHPDAKATEIDVIGISGPAPSCISHYTLGGFPNSEAGLVSDVAISPDGAFAVVHCRNHIVVIPVGNMADQPITVFDTSTMTAPGTPGFYPGGTIGTLPGPQSDSVAMTNTRAIVATTRNYSTAAGTLYPHTWVYIVDLTTTPPSLALVQNLVLNDGIAHSTPHDVAVTPDGNLAVVSMSQQFALFSLAGTPALVGTYQQLNDLRTYSMLPMPVDSVELTNGKAVLLSSLSQGGANQEVWSVTVADIVDASGVPGISNVYVFSPTPGSGVVPPDQPHDLALYDDGIKPLAVIKSHKSEAIVDINAHSVQFRAATAFPFHPPGDVFFSDSVMIGEPTGSVGGGPPTHQYAVMIGTEQDLVTLKWKAVTSFIDLKNPAGPFLTAPLVVSDPAFDVVPSDLVLGRTRLDALVRCLAPPDESNPAAGGRDFLRVLLDPPVEHKRFGGRGERILAMDSIDFGPGAAVSVAEFVTPEPMTGAYGTVHFVSPGYQ